MVVMTILESVLIALFLGRMISMIQSTLSDCQLVTHSQLEILVLFPGTASVKITHQSTIVSMSGEFF